MTSDLSPLQRALARAATGLLGAVVLLPAVLSGALPAAATTTDSGACPEGSGVTVVVDKTDLGGEVEVRCAADGAPDGTSALRAAGFVDTRDDANMICAIDALPDPCPTTWEGSYWSYWYAEGGDWVAYQEGPDTAQPTGGGIEGWRYNDGSVGPGVEPAALVVPGEPAAEEQPSPSAPSDEVSGSPDDVAGEVDGAESSGSPWQLLTVVAAVAVLTAAVVALLLVARRRRDQA